MMPTKKFGMDGPTRHGVAATEFAICLPLIVMLLLASIEACSMIHLNHSLSITSYEGVRVAIDYDSTTTDVMDRCNEMITEREVNGAAVQIDPTDVTTVPRGQTIAVTVTAPCDSNALIPPWFFGGMTLNATTVMVKE